MQTEKYGNLPKELENKYLKWTYQCPKNMVPANNLLVNWKNDPRKHGSNGPTTDSMDFTNIDRGGDDD